MLSAKTVAITGSSGFIGRSVTDYMLGVDWYVRGLDIVDRIDVPLKSHFVMYKGNLLEPTNRVERDYSLHGTHVLVHTAGITDGPASTEHDPVIVAYNCELVQEALALCADNEIPCMINVSSAAVYGKAPGPYREDGPTEPISPYGVSKLAAESIVDRTASSLGLRAFSIRLFSPVGRDVRRDSLIQTALFAGSGLGPPVPLYGVSWRAYTWVHDFSRLVTFIADNFERWPPGHYIFNFGETNALSQTRLFREIEKFIQAPIPYVFCEPRPREIESVVPNMDNTKLFLGDFVSSNGLDNGIKEAILAFRARNGG